MNRKEIRDLVRKKLGETTEAFWTDAELNSWIYLACVDVAYRTKALRKETTITFPAEAESILTDSFATDLQGILSIVFNGSTIKRLRAIPFDDLTDTYPQWRNIESSEPELYYHVKEMGLLGVYPKIKDTENDNLNIVYTYKHPSISSDSASPLFDDFLHQAVVDNVVSVGMESRGWVEKAAASWNKYINTINDYLIESKRQKEDEEIIMKNYRNI